MRMCGDFDPADNDQQLRFPDDFFEILIDDNSYQHKVSNIQELNKGDHIRFRNANRWYMGWINSTGGSCSKFV